MNRGQQNPAGGLVNLLSPTFIIQDSLYWQKNRARGYKPSVGPGGGTVTLFFVSTWPKHGRVEYKSYPPGERTATAIVDKNPPYAFPGA